jgi:hypothetical protein
MRACRHAFLIRHPARVLASYAAKREPAELRDIGLLEQVELFDTAADMSGRPPPVLDADTLLGDPAKILRRLCVALGIPFSEMMLNWPAGPRETDGVWAPYWYEAVNRSTGFEPARPMRRLKDPALLRLQEEALPLYEKLARFALS